MQEMNEKEVNSVAAGLSVTGVLNNLPPEIKVAAAALVAPFVIGYLANHVNC